MMCCKASIVTFVMTTQEQGNNPIFHVSTVAAIEHLRPHSSRRILRKRFPRQGNPQLIMQHDVGVLAVRGHHLRDCKGSVVQTPVFSVQVLIDVKSCAKPQAADRAS